MTYYLSEDDGSGPEPGRPMTRDEMLSEYPEISKDDPTFLADLYIDFHDFDRIEFLVFKDRLSSAVFIAAMARRGIDEVLTRSEITRKNGSHRVPGWEGESEMALDEAVGIAKYSYKISIGATIVTAVAALESLLADLASTSRPSRRGLHSLLQAFLRQHRVPSDEAAIITGLERKIAERRNTFAHSLTGSYWGDAPSLASMFTSETMEDTLHTVGELSVWLERIVSRGQ